MNDFDYDEAQSEGTSEEEEYEEEEAYIEEHPVDLEMRQQLAQAYRDALEEREKFIQVNLGLQKRLRTYFGPKKTDGKEEEEKVKVNPNVDGTGGVMDVADRYERYVAELREMRKELTDLKLKYKTALNELQEKLAVKVVNADELQSSFRAYMSSMAMSAENSKTGKPIPEKVISQYQRQLEKKDSEIRDIRIAYIRRKNTKDLLDQHIKEKEEFSKGLHLIDIEQLRIENSTHTERIEERNEDLAKSRKKATTTVHILTHVKEKLQFVQSDNQELKKSLVELESEANAHKDILSVLKKERDALKTENLQIRDSMPLVGSDALLINFEQQKDDTVYLTQKLRELKERHAQIVKRVAQYNKQIPSQVNTV